MSPTDSSPSAYSSLAETQSTIAHLSYFLHQPQPVSVACIVAPARTKIGGCCLGPGLRQRGRADVHQRGLLPKGGEGHGTWAVSSTAETDGEEGRETRAQRGQAGQARSIPA